jgi:hypothetical protein
MKTGQRLWRQKKKLGSQRWQRRKNQHQHPVLTQRLREKTPTENLVGRDAIRRQLLHSAPLSLG